MYENSTQTLSTSSSISFLRSCFLNLAVTAERFMTISVTRVTTHFGLPKSQLPDSSASEAELSSQQMSWVWCQLVAYRHFYDLILFLI